MAAYFPSLLAIACTSIPHIIIAADSQGVIKAGDWTYGSGPTGAENWGSIKPEYQTCGAGQVQSPIDVSSCDAKSTSGSPVVHFFNSSMKFSAAQNNYKLDCKNSDSMPCGEVRYNSTAYKLLHMHAHSPSENTLNNVSYPLEMHFVHQSTKNELAVVGVFFKFGEENEEIAKFLKVQNKTMVDIDLSKLYHEHAMICTFPGSLTTPPCTEGVQWIVSWGVLEISSDQMVAFQELTGNVTTNRPIQPLNGRNITCYH